MLAGSEGRPLRIDSGSFDVWKMFQEILCKKDSGECIPKLESYELQNGSIDRGDGKRIVAGEATPDMLTVDPSKTFDAETLATELNLHASEYVDCSTGTLMSVDPTLVQQFHPEACFDPIELGIVYDPLFEECRAEYEGGISQSMSDYLPTTTDPATVTTMWDKMISPWKLDQLNFREGYLFGAVKDFVSVASKKIPDFTVTPTSVSDEPGTSKGAQIALLKETKAELESNIISATVAKAGQSAEEQIASGDPATGMVAEVASWRTKLAETVAQIATLEKKGSPDDQANAMLLHVNAMMHCFQDTAHDLGAPWRKLSEGKNMSAAMIVQCLAPSLTAKGDALSFKAIDLSMAAYAQGDPIKVSFGNLVRAMKMYTDTVTLRGLHNVQLRMLPPAVQKELATKMKSIFDRLKAGKLTEAKAKTEMDALFSKDELKPLRATAVKIEEKLIESQSFLKQVNPDNLDVAGFQLYQDFVGLLQDEVKRSAQALMMAQVKETPVAADPVKPVTTKPKTTKPKTTKPKTTKPKTTKPKTTKPKGFRCGLGFKVMSSWPTAKITRYSTWSQANCK